MNHKSTDSPFHAPVFAEAISKGGRTGTLSSPGRPIDITLGVAGASVNPELLFAGAYAACFHSAMIGLATKLGTPLVDSTVRARTCILADGEGGGRLTVELYASVPGFVANQVRDLMEKAHQICAYSRALRGDAVVTLLVD